MLPAFPDLAESPLFRDFVGINGHTVRFKPDLYQSVCRIVYGYHPAGWDLAKNTGTLPEWPFAKAIIRLLP